MILILAHSMVSFLRVSIPIYRFAWLVLINIIHARMQCGAHNNALAHPFPLADPSVGRIDDGTPTSRLQSPTSNTTSAMPTDSVTAYRPAHTTRRREKVPLRSRDTGYGLVSVIIYSQPLRLLLPHRHARAHRRACTHAHPHACTRNHSIDRPAQFCTWASGHA